MLSLISITLNVAFCTIYVLSRSLRSSSFFSLATSLSVVDSLQLLFILIYGSFSSYVGYNLGGDRRSRKALRSVCRHSIAVNASYKLTYVFSQKNTTFLILLSWLCGLVLVIPNFFSCCYQYYY